ncbi:MAG: extracellular solute-binding protein [Chloroflexi bacterium]|nr:extracellular solute-binding protein [Chloroflexota bacterium]
MQIRILFLIFLIGACAPMPTPTPPATPTATRAPTAPPTIALSNHPTIAPSPTPIPAPIILRFWHALPYAHHPAFNARVKHFNATHPDIQIAEAYQGDYAALIKKARDDQPDAILAYADDIAEFAQRGAVIALDDWLTDAKDIFPAFIDRDPHANNKIYSVAFARSLQVMYYNADLLKWGGFSKPPTTWDEFAQVCAAIAKIPDTTCYALNPNATTFALWLYNRGGEFFSADGKTILLNQKPGLDTLTFLSELFKKKSALLTTRAFQEPSDFAAGKIAFTFDTTNGLPLYDRAIKSASKPIAWGIAPSPRTTREPVVIASGPSIAIFKTSPDRERAAFVFAQWLIENAEWQSATGTLPARASMRGALAEYIKTNPQYGAAFDLLRFARTEPNIAGWGAMRVPIADAMLAVANGKVPADALNDAAKKIERP